MKVLVALGKVKLGPVTEGRKYCLKIPGVLSGAYGGDNLATAPQVKLVRLSGDFARQIQDLPAGSQIRLHVVD